MNKRKTGSKIWGLISVFVTGGLILVACRAFTWGASSFNAPSLNAGSGDGIDANNGEMIYFTASSKRDGRIGYRGGPAFGGMMMGSYLTCAACHGPEAQGGIHWMHMQVMEAPDIRYSALIHEAEEHEGEGHAGEEGGEYDFEDFHRAVIEGKHPDDEALSRDMPRWRMNDEDLADLFEFLKSFEE